MAFFPTRQILLQIGPLAIHWYGVMYLIAFLLTWWLLPLLAKKKGYAFTKEDVGNILFAGILGTILGGRLGYVLFYAPEYYGEHPLEILAVWKGGMSSHGGFIGVTLALLTVFRSMHDRITLWQLGDLLTVPIAIGLALGRIGNFINLELYGPVTSLPWGIAIPGIDELRHPTPLYAMMKDFFIAGICFFTLFKMKKAGVTFGIFLTLYGVLRFIVEFWREETASGLNILGVSLTRGQALTIPVIIIGVYIFWRRMRTLSLPSPSAEGEGTR